MNIHKLRLKALDQIKDDIKINALQEIYELLEHVPPYALTEYIVEEIEPEIKEEQNKWKIQLK